MWQFPQNQLPGHFIWDINTYFLEFHLQSIWVYLHLVKFTKLKHTSSAVPQRNQAGYCFKACGLDFLLPCSGMACSPNSFKALCSGIVFIPTVLKISRHTSTLKTQTLSSCLVIFVVLLPSTTYYNELIFFMFCLLILCHNSQGTGLKFVGCSLCSTYKYLLKKWKTVFDLWLCKQLRQ